MKANCFRRRAFAPGASCAWHAVKRPTQLVDIVWVFIETGRGRDINFSIVPVTRKHLALHTARGHHVRPVATGPPGRTQPAAKETNVPEMRPIDRSSLCDLLDFSHQASCTTAVTESLSATVHQRGINNPSSLTLWATAATALPLPASLASNRT